MTFLEMCRRLRLEAGISGAGPTSVTGQTGDYEKVVEWVKSAYQDIQNTHDRWLFLQGGFSFNTVAGTQEYTATAAGITDLATWKFQQDGDMRAYSSYGDEQWLEYMPWADFRANYLYGSSRETTGKPTTFTVKPNNALVFYPIPHDAYTIDGEYWKVPDTLSANSDTPIFPARFHMAIVWRALVFYGAKVAAEEAYQHGAKEYDKLMDALERDQLPKIIWGNPLA